MKTNIEASRVITDIIVLSSDSPSLKLIYSDGRDELVSSSKKFNTFVNSISQFHGGVYVEHCLKGYFFFFIDGNGIDNRCKISRNLYEIFREGGLEY